MSYKPISPVPLSNPQVCLRYAQTHLFELCPDLMEMVYEQTIRCRLNKVLVNINYKTWSPSFQKTYRRILNEVKKKHSFNIVRSNRTCAILSIHFARIWIRLIRPDIKGFMFNPIDSPHQKSINIYGIYMNVWKCSYNGRIIYGINETVVDIDKACKENKLVGFKRSWRKSDKIGFLCNYKE